MDPNAIAGMIFTLLLAGLVGGFILLYPVSRRLGLLLEEKLHPKRPPPGVSADALEALQQSVHALEGEVKRLTERQDFM